MHSATQRPPIESTRAVRLLQAVSRFYVRTVHNLTVTSPCQLPRIGPAILVCNHTCALDPLLIQAACPRLITWMMAAEYFNVKSVATICRAVGAIPTNRSGQDTAATRAALRVLHDGGILGIFPEGKIETSDELLPFHNGVAMMAMRTGIPVHPARLDGSQRGKDMIRSFLSGNTTILSFGAPLHFDRGKASDDDLGHATKTIRQAIAGMRTNPGS